MQTSEGTVLWKQIQGCPQGSCSGPAFWNIVADEILSVQWPQGVHLQAFAYDFTFIVTDNTREGLRKLRKLELDKFKDWANKNKLHVSMEKSSYVLFSKLVRGATIKWGNPSISRKYHLKYLGVTIDHTLSWLPHVIEQSKRAMDQYQHVCRISGKTWGINKNIRRLLYKTVIERTLCHGAAAWGHNMTSRLQKKLDSIQRLFLLYITGAYRTTPTIAPQVVTGLQPLHLQIQQEATYARIARARSSSNFFTVIFNPTDYESKSSGIHIHPPPPDFLLHKQISLAENHIDSGVKAIYKLLPFIDQSKFGQTSLSYLKSEIKLVALNTWQDNWDNSETGRSAHDIVPRVSNKPVEWNREEIMSVRGHGPFSSYLHRFNLRTHDNCSCGEKGDPIHYATKCWFTLSWHFQIPTVSLKLQWLKNILTNNLSRTQLRLLMRFICDENNLIVEDNN
ncbi:Retrovirus-related Pol polyprotein from type-1 retrotransposable element R1 [Araneus ventricosus]|uniref:Retrovirus-related Pol polyprotein from type-1 retrotransposable element R1 n=1 Tax=Araneus ventricosus TaxID=182803 RepID=A0A4Y2A8A3_ARAVE|nr:Retrovirus-related Pol polyprotein from type-1 retrotransposable element R1 [Araneus ventricosus]